MMYSSIIAIMIPIDATAQTHSVELQVAKLCERMLKSPLLHTEELDNMMLEKPSHLAVSDCRSIYSKPPTMKHPGPPGPPGPPSHAGRFVTCRDRPDPGTAPLPDKYGRRMGNYGDWVGVTGIDDPGIVRDWNPKEHLTRSRPPRPRDPGSGLDKVEPREPWSRALDKVVVPSRRWPGGRGRYNTYDDFNKPMNIPEQALELEAQKRAIPAGFKDGPMGLMYRDMAIGKGDLVVLGDTFQANYVIQLFANGAKHSFGNSFIFRAGTQIPERPYGFDLTVLGEAELEPMRVGGKRIAIMHPWVAFGTKNRPMMNNPLMSLVEVIVEVVM